MPLPRNSVRIAAFVAASLSLACCHPKEDPALQRKNEEQKAEISRLQGDITVLEEKIKEAPPDRTKELEKAKKESETQTADIAKLQADVAELEARRNALEAEFKQYRDKYPIK